MNYLSRNKEIFLSVIMPAFNEAGRVEKVIRDHYQVLSSLQSPLKDWEIICLDDGSTDGTPEILDGLSRQLSKLRVIRHSVNQGIYRSYCDLFKEARGTHIYRTDSDGQWPTENLVKMLEYLASSGVDLIIGVREQRDQVYNSWRQILSFGFNWLAEALFKVKTLDANGSKLGRKEIFDLPLSSQSFFGEIERIVKAKGKGYKIGFIPIQYIPRSGGKSRAAKWKNIIFTLRDCLRYLVTRS